MTKIINTTATINNVNEKENKTMKKDYTLNGTINATTWKEFREEMKKIGINPATKTYVQLVEEYNALPKDNIVSVGDMSSDKYEEEINHKPSITIKQKDGDYIIKNIYKASYIKTRGDNKNKMTIKMNVLFGIIKDNYSPDKKNLPQSFIESVINELVRLKYLTFKRYESGKIAFYPTTKVRDYVKGSVK